MEFSGTQQEEIELLRRIGQGDRASFEQFYDRFSRVLFSIAYRLLRNEQAAEDVLQEVFVQIWKKAPLYDPTRGKPMTWAVTLTRHRAIDIIRSTQRRGQLHEEVKLETEVREKFDDHDSFAAATSGERHSFVREAMQKLSGEQREALELAFFGSLTQAEIAERLDLPLGTVKARIRRGMMKLRGLIGPRL
ncbi:MAG: sigma-70 family RNA polymerase sigma factor [Chthoniobacterales bacterium]|nr:sigma-70 family RNA polymerase sigma factor [Chthoniobacterales bacterium]